MSARRPLSKLGFLHIVPFTRDDPARGLQEALRLFEYGEELGLDGGWIRTRHVQYGVPSAAVFLAAAAQRTRRLELGTAVIPTVYESPLRLAEDLGLADLLSDGRLQPGLSVGPAKHSDQVAENILGPGWREEDISYGRLERILGFIRGVQVDETEREIGLGGAVEMSSDRVEPHSEGLASRIWYGGGSLRSAEWAGRTGLKLLVSNICSADGFTEFELAQRAQIDRFREHHPAGERAVVSKGHVILPTDNATAQQREKFEAYVEARTPRTRYAEGARTLIARDIIGSTEEIVERIRQDLGFQGADEILIELPFQFDDADVRHIVREFAENIGPALGWSPASQSQAVK
ncbi:MULTISPECIES: LLM class flavin-dependent oxidoreductase [Arthrobacter]|uniref:LLM class flavin-dependent oxidoreductase n=2 Tax=Arthrobacter TaxID=1663 RepID=A0ABU9KMP6_9MICC|nr:LLM class flavin-dependent oxidoreductase [Arthrobacter sp. YJM1]MDP5228013.1 LLM class flavin-dependent oxidoreductase [Arthrobacter sp. YJM1]